MKTHIDTCKRKRKYPKKKMAESEAKQTPFKPYLCNVCGKWHLTSKYKTEA